MRALQLYFIKLVPNLSWLYKSHNILLKKNARNVYILYSNEEIIKEINMFSENRKLNFFGPAQVDLNYVEWESGNYKTNKLHKRWNI